MISSSGKNRENYRTGGGKKTTQGTTYHLELLMVMFLRGLGGGYQFSLATEMEDAGKFDDIIFRYDSKDNGKRTYRLIQIKHRAESSTSKITLSALLSTSKKADYGVLTYFNSFRKVKREFLKNGEDLRDVIIYTNGDFKWGDKQQMFKMDVLFVKRKNNHGNIEVDDLFQTELLYFTKDAEERKKWLDFLMENITEEKDVVEEDAMLYFEKFAFAVKQPDEKDLSLVIMGELKRKYKITDLSAAYSLFRDEMHKWMTSPEGYYLHHAECQNFVHHLMKKYGAINFGSRSPTSNFTGREKELKELREAYLDRTKTIVVSGLGGIGKTQLVSKFIAEYSDRFDSIAWMNAESREDLMRSFRRLAVDKLDIKETVEDGKPKDMKSILEEVYQFFLNRKCVIVFDNVNYSEEESKGDYVLEFYPKFTPKPFLIMTSRYQSWDSLKVVKLMEFMDEEARYLIKTSLGHDLASDEDEVRALAKELHNYPLALQQALAYIKKTAKRADKFGVRRGISEYLQLYEKNSKILLEQRVEKFSGDAYEKTTCNTWDVTLEEIRNGENGELAERILQMASYMAPDVIETKEINKCFESEDEETIKSSLLLLDDYTMIMVENDKITIHRLVQKITRMRGREMGEERGIIESALKVSPELEVQNSISLWGYAIEYKDLAKKYLNVPINIITTFKEKHRYKEGCLFGDKFIPQLKMMLGTMENDVVKAMFLLADVTYLDGKYYEALEQFQEVHKCQTNNLSIGHPESLTSMNNMASLLENLGKYEEALKMHECIFEIRRRFLGENHPATLTSMNNTASVFESLGRLNECLKLNIEVFEKRKRVLGDEHPDTMNSMHNTASVLQSLGRYEECLKLNVEIYEKKKLVLGEEHPLTLVTMSNMASVLQSLGRYQECLNLTEEVHRKNKKVLSENHPHTLSGMNNLAIVLHDLGKLEESLRLTREVYEKKRDVLGVNHPDTLASMNNMAALLKGLEKYEECLKCTKEVYERKRLVLGDEHPDTLISMSNMGIVLECLGRFDESLKFTKEVYEIRERVLGGEHPNTLSSMSNIASVLSSLGRHEESLKLSQIVCEKRKRILSDEHPDTLTSMNNMAFVLYELRRYNESLELHKEVYEKRKKVLGENHPNTLLSKSNWDSILNVVNKPKCSLM